MDIHASLNNSDWFKNSTVNTLQFRRNLTRRICNTFASATPVSNFGAATSVPWALQFQWLQRCNAMALGRCRRRWAILTWKPLLKEEILPNKRYLLPHLQRLSATASGGLRMLLWLLVVLGVVFAVPISTRSAFSSYMDKCRELTDTDSGHNPESTTTKLTDVEKQYTASSSVVFGFGTLAHHHHWPLAIPYCSSTDRNSGNPGWPCHSQSAHRYWSTTHGILP